MCNYATVKNKYYYLQSIQLQPLYNLKLGVKNMCIDYNTFPDDL